MEYSRTGSSPPTPRRDLRSPSRFRRSAVAVMMTICVGASGPPAVAAPNSFSATGSLHTARYVYNQDLIRLCDGRQLIAGGSVPGASTATAEIYDPATGVWTVVASMREARSSHSATLLSDCRVLVDNGGATTLGSAEIYNPVTNIWTTVGSLGVGRYNPTAFRLPSGKVLVAGGGVPGSGDTVATSSAELFDPATGTWSPTGSLNTPRMNQSGAQFLDGRVVVSGGMPHGGGYSGGGFDTAEIYDPATEVWTYTGNTMATGRRGFHSMTTLPSGQVLVAGGHVTSGGDPTSSAELLDPASTLWTPTASMPSGRFFHSATVLRGGTVLIAGGLVGSTYLDDAYIFDPSDPTWTAVTSHLGEVRALHQAALLDNGKVLIAGGWNGTNELATSELYSPVWSVRGFYEPVDMRSAGHPIRARELTIRALMGGVG